MKESSTLSELMPAPSEEPVGDDSALPFSMGFVAKRGDIVGACFKFSLDAAKTAVIHLDTALTAQLMQTLTGLRRGALRPWNADAATHAHAGVSLDLSEREIGEVTTRTAARRYDVSNTDDGVAITFELRNGRAVVVPFTVARVDRLLARMDACVTELTQLRDARGTLH